MADTLLPTARKVLAGVDPDLVPLYGSADFLDTDVADPRWLASVIRAAECWRLHHEPDQVAIRLHETNQEFARRIRMASHDISGDPMPRWQPWPRDAGVPDGFYGHDYPKPVMPDA